MINNLVLTNPTGQALLILAVGGAVGAASAYLGSFMILKRMSLVGDALSHVALPGMAIAIALNVSPMLGAFTALIIATIGVWYLQETSQVYPEALIGVFFTASLAIGILITPEPDLLEALFGNIEKMKVIESFIAIFLSIGILLLTQIISKKLMLGIISEDLAKSAKIPTKAINFIYLLLVGSVVGLGVRFVGSLLMGALVIIPAASAKNVSRSLNSFYLLSTFLGIVSGVGGVMLAQTFHTASGPIVVLVSVIIFIVSYILKSIL